MPKPGHTLFGLELDQLHPGSSRRWGSARYLPKATDRPIGHWLIAASGRAAKTSMRQIVNFGMTSNAKMEWLGCLM